MRRFVPRANREFTGKFLRFIGGIAGLSLLFFASATTPVSGKQVQTVGREELEKVINKGQKLKVVLGNGAYGEGMVEQVDQQRLVLNVTKTSDSQELAKGRHEIALKRVASVTFSAYKGNKRKWLAVVLPATIGTAALVIAGGTASEDQNYAYVPIAIALTAGLGVGGYYGGKALDRKEITITFK